MIGREEAGVAEAVVHRAQISRAGKDIVARIVRIGTQIVRDTELCPSARHQLHQSHGSGPAGDRLPVKTRPAAALGAHDSLRYEEHTSELQSLMRNSYAV